MQGINENDARAAMRVWVETVVKQTGARAEPDVLYCNSLTNLIAALRDRSVDGAAILSSEFYTLRPWADFNRFVFGMTDGSIEDEYVLLAHRESSLTKIEDLKGRSLKMLKQSRMCLAIPWLDTVLMENAELPVRRFCRQIDEENKLTKTVLSVFFHQADACLVTAKGFKTMCELNPQIHRQLRVLATSPKYVTTGFFFRRGYPAADQDQFISELVRVQERPIGQQFLTVFQTQRLEERAIDALDSVISLLRNHERLSGDDAARSAVTTQGTVSAAQVGGGR